MWCGRCRRALDAADKAIAARDTVGAATRYDAEFRRAGFVGEVEALRRCVRMGANPNASDNEGHTALHMAAAAGRLQALSALVALGVNLDGTNNAGQTALHMAASSGQLECVEQLVSLRCAVAVGTELLIFYLAGATSKWSISVAKPHYRWLTTPRTCGLYGCSLTVVHLVC